MLNKLQYIHYPKQNNKTLLFIFSSHLASNMPNKQYLKKLSKINQTVEQQRLNLSKLQSQVISNAQKPITTIAQPQPNPYTTPTKPPSSATTGSHSTGYPSSTPSAINSSIKPSHLNPNSSIQNPNQSSHPSSSQVQPSQYPSQLQLQQEEEERKRRQKQEEDRRRKIKQQQQQRKKMQQQFQNYLQSNSKIKTLLQQKSKFIEIEYQKQQVYWNDQRTRYEDTIAKLQAKVEEKDNKIAQFIQIVAKLKHQLKAALEKCVELDGIVADLKEQNSLLKGQNVQYKLENKNLKVDNKVVIGHLDKMLKEQLKDKDKTARQIFEQRQKRVINSLYSRTLSAPSDSKQSKQEQWLPSQVNQLSNKVKLQKFLQDYKQHRQQCCRTIGQLQNTVKNKDEEIKGLNYRIMVLETNFKKMAELRDTQRQSNIMKDRLIGEYKKQLTELSIHNGKISDQLEKYYHMPRIKQKIGCISRARKIPLREYDQDTGRVIEK